MSKAKEERRIEILQAAGRVFYLKGFEGTKIEDVAREAGIGKGTVYEYFDSKQQLFDEMVSYTREQHLNNIKVTLQAEGTFRDKFLALARYQTEMVSRHIHVFNAMACSKVMAREMGALFLEQNIRVGEIMKRLVMEAITKDELRSDINPELAAAVIMGTVNQYCNKKVIFFNVRPEEMDYEQLVDIVMRGIGRE